MNILHLSDTHGSHRRLHDLPEADIVVHSGDFTMTGVVVIIRVLREGLIVIMRIGNSDAFGDALTELRRSDDFGMTAVAEYQPFQFIINYDF